MEVAPNPQGTVAATATLAVPAGSAVVAAENAPRSGENVVGAVAIAGLGIDV